MTCLLARVEARKRESVKLILVWSGWIQPIKMSGFMLIQKAV